MPLDTAGNEHRPVLAIPTGICATDDLFVIRYTGELFVEYAEYLQALAKYRQRVWTCARTGTASLTYEEALSSEAGPTFQTSQQGPDNVVFPHAYVKPCLELVHGATTRLDELCNTIVNFLRCNCVPDEVVQLLPDNSNKREAIVKCPVQGQESNATNKHYVVEMDGTTHVVPMSEMGRACYQLTKTSVKAWLNSVSRQQSLGIKGMTCVWLVRPELLKELDIPDKLPKHIDQQLRKTAKRREQRQRAKQRAKEASAAVDVSAGKQALHDPVPVAQGSSAAPIGGLLPAQLQGQTGAAMHAHPSLAPNGTATPGSENRDAANAGNVPHDVVSTPAHASAPAAGITSHPLTSPAAEALDETESRLEAGTLKKGIFLVLKDAGPAGLGVSEIMDGLKRHGFDWGANTRGGKSSIASTCRHDNIFLRLGPGRFTLRALPGALEHVHASATCSRQELEAAKMVCALEARQAAAQACITSSGLKKQPFTKNTFKCSKCMRVYHPSGSPLVLCDYCPKAFHVECLPGATITDLPPGDWGCPKCYEKQAANKQKLEDLAAKKKEALERVASAERKREKQAAKRQHDKEERERRRTENRQGKDPLKRGAVAPGPDTELLPVTDDLDLMHEEQQALQALEGGGSEGDVPDAATAAAVWAANILAPEGSRIDPGQVDAGQRLAQMRLRVQGPPEPHWVTDTARDTKLLREALAVVEFMTVMRSVLLCEAVPLPALLAAVHRPLHSSLLPDLYTTLLRSCLLEVVHLEAPLKRSRAKRWGRTLDRHTWPEVLRRYLLASRAGLPMSDKQLYETDVADLAPDAVAVLAALQLGRQPWWTLSPALHTLLLSALCDDIVQGTRLRADINVRFEEIAALHTERYHSQAEERKREKENAKVRKDKLQTLRDIEARAEAENLSSDAKPTAAELAEAQSLRDELMADGDDERRGGGQQQKAREREREAEFEKRLDGKAVRSDMLGWDRHQRSYWWMQSTAHVLWVFGMDAARMGFYVDPGHLQRLCVSLLEGGIRERGLSQGLAARYEALVANLASLEGAGELQGLRVHFPEDADEDAAQNQDPADAAAMTQAEAAFTEAAKALMQSLLQMCQECNLSVARCTELAPVVAAANAANLVEVVRHVEKVVSRFSEGLPKEADDTNMAAPVAEVEMYRAEFVLPASAKPEESDPTKGAEGSAAGLSNDDGGDGGQEGVGDAAADEDGGQRGEASAVTQVVAALEELDDSDAEPESKSGSTYDEFGNRYPNKPLRLWRTRRDRTVWLKDVRRAELMGSASALVFCCATMLDRVQPMAVRIQNRMSMQRASRAASVGGEGGEEHSEGAQEGTGTDSAAGAAGVEGTASGHGAVGSGNITGMKRDLDPTSAPTGGPQQRRKLNRPLWDTMFRCLGVAVPAEGGGKVVQAVQRASAAVAMAPPSRSASAMPAAVDEAMPMASEAETEATQSL